MEKNTMFGLALKQANTFVLDDMARKRLKVAH